MTSFFWWSIEWSRKGETDDLDSSKMLIKSCSYPPLKPYNGASCRLWLLTFLFL